MYKKQIFIGLALLFLLGCTSSPSIERETEFKDAMLYGFPKNDSLRKALHPYGNLLGDWNCHIFTKNNGNWVKDTAYWSFQTILDGAAIQDFWLNPAPPSKGKNQDFIGTNIRVPDSKTNQWTVIWIQNINNSVQGFWTSYENENREILIKDSTNTWEIKFYDIGKEKFLWEWKFLKDSVWEVTTKIEAVRMGSDQPYTMK